MHLQSSGLCNKLFLFNLETVLRQYAHQAICILVTSGTYHQIDVEVPLLMLPLQYLQ